MSGEDEDWGEPLFADQDGPSASQTSAYVHCGEAGLRRFLSRDSAALPGLQVEYVLRLHGPADLLDKARRLLQPEPTQSSHSGQAIGPEDRSVQQQPAPPTSSSESSYPWGEREEIVTKKILLADRAAIKHIVGKGGARLRRYLNEYHTRVAVDDANLCASVQGKPHDVQATVLDIERTLHWFNIGGAEANRPS